MAAYRWKQTDQFPPKEIHIDNLLDAWLSFGGATPSNQKPHRVRRNPIRLRTEGWSVRPPRLGVIDSSNNSHWVSTPVACINTAHNGTPQCCRRLHSDGSPLLHVLFPFNCSQKFSAAALRTQRRSQTVSSDDDGPLSHCTEAPRRATELLRIVTHATNQFEDPFMPEPIFYARVKKRMLVGKCIGIFRKRLGFKNVSVRESDIELFSSYVSTRTATTNARSMVPLSATSK